MPAVTRCRYFRTIIPTQMGPTSVHSNIAQMHTRNPSSLSRPESSLDAPSAEGAVPLRAIWAIRRPISPRETIAAPMNKAGYNEARTLSREVLRLD